MVVYAAVPGDSQHIIPLRLIGAGINMWFGVSRAGYSVKEEIPFFFIVFLIPAAGAVLVWWKYSRG